MALPIAVASAPILRRLFPEDAEWPAWWQVGLLFIGSMSSHDLVCTLDFYGPRLMGKLCLKEGQEVPKVLRGAIAWGGRFVQPVEIVLQALDAITGPMLWSIFAGSLPVTLWWAWVALLQALWVVDRSHYSFPSPSSLLAQLMPDDKKKNRKGKPTKPNMKEAAQKRAR